MWRTLKFAIYYCRQLSDTHICYLWCIVCVIGSEIYYVGIVDASYNTGRQRPDQASVCYYMLRVWSGQCVYWDDVVDQWSGSGCCLHESSTFELAQCRYMIHFTQHCIVFHISQVQCCFMSVLLSYGLSDWHLSSSPYLHMCVLPYCFCRYLKTELVSIAYGVN